MLKIHAKIPSIDTASRISCTEVRQGFRHFEYANPNAPKCGTLRMPQLGTFDSFNNILDKGRVLAGFDLGGAGALVYDTLLDGPADEVSAAYCRIAEGVAVEKDYKWVAFKLRKEAHWHDGTPLTVDDVIFTFDAFKEHGSVGLKTALRDLDVVFAIGNAKLAL